MPSETANPAGRKMKCESCAQLRELSLHLHELSRFCEYLANERQSLRRGKGKLRSGRPVRTATIARWLIIASQIEEVRIDTYQFQEAHIYCEPVDGLLQSDAEHGAAIATPLTRFVFVCNALEEAYRFIGPTYEVAYEEQRTCSPSAPYWRSPAMQAAFMLDSQSPGLPVDYEHLVRNLWLIAKQYAADFGCEFELEWVNPAPRSFGLDILRVMRNQVAHGVFPLIQNPEYAPDVTASGRRNLINLLNQLCRVGGLVIQMLLAQDNDGFQSGEYFNARDDDEYGEWFAERCSFSYLVDIHRKQAFGLNESAYFGWSTMFDGSE